MKRTAHLLATSLLVLAGYHSITEELPTQDGAPVTTKLRPKRCGSWKKAISREKSSPWAAGR